MDPLGTGGVCGWAGGVGHVSTAIPCGSCLPIFNISCLKYRPLGRRTVLRSGLFCLTIPGVFASFIVAIIAFGEVHLAIDEVHLDVVMILAENRVKI